MSPIIFVESWGVTLLTMYMFGQMIVDLFESLELY